MNSEAKAITQGDQFITVGGFGTGILLGDRFSKAHFGVNFNQYQLTTSEFDKSYFAIAPTAGFRLALLAETYFQMDVSTLVPTGGDDIRLDMAVPETGLKPLDSIDFQQGYEVRASFGVGF